MSEVQLQNQLRALRSRLGISQQELARTAGVTRQTIGGIEAGHYAPTAAVALRIARSLGCRVEEVFWLEGEQPILEATIAGSDIPIPGTRVSVAQIGGRWVAHPLTGRSAFRQELIPADGITLEASGSGLTRIELTDDPDTLQRTVVLAGCTPALSLWSRSAERWHPGLRVHWVHANSTAALHLLARGEVHAAGIHLRDPHTGECNIPFVRKMLPGKRVSLVSLGEWQEGLVVARGNPLSLTGMRDLGRPEVRLINREEGSGARTLLDAKLSDSGLRSDQVRGYDRIASSHQEIARMVESGVADVGVSTETVAALFGLGFVPLERVRYDLAIPSEHMVWAPVRTLLSTLQHRWVRTQLRIMGGYDTSGSGEVIEIR